VYRLIFYLIPVPELFLTILKRPRRALNAVVQMWLAASRPRPWLAFVEHDVCPADGDNANTVCLGRRKELLPRSDSQHQRWLYLNRVKALNQRPQLTDIDPVVGLRCEKRKTCAVKDVLADNAGSFVPKFSQ